MAHIPPSTAIFSPSVARLAATTAKDWNYVDSWLSTKFHGRSAPRFERNPDTLKVLLALAALNETADEERDLVARVEASALQDLNKYYADGSGDAAAAAAGSTSASRTATIQDAVLDAVEEGLSREGRAALDSMAATAVELGVAYAEPEALGRKLTELQARTFELEQAVARVGVLQRHVEAETARSKKLLAELDGDEYRPAANLAKSNLELQRRIKAAAARLPETKPSAISSAEPSVDVSIQQAREEEEKYLELLAYKKSLDTRLQSFQGLPPDKDLARQELEALRTELRAITRRRDAVFEGLVERETPRKGH